MSFSTSSFVAKFAILLEVILPFLLLVSVVAPTQAVVVPVHHILRRDSGFHSGGGEFHDHDRHNGNTGAASSSEVASDSATSVATEATTDNAAATPTTSTDTIATATATASVSGTTYTGGYATYFYQEGVAGACGTVHSDSDYIVAVDEDMYSSSLCGKTVVITNEASGAQVTATVADECPGCATSTSLDLSVAAFEALSDLSVGTFSITWVLED
ncbi:RlpA-like double-psi beta-barrel-protein domain-containing protein-containing protein [Lentinula detonsa]|uniref:RlpA-like double-psi beta-barrel-protein domain-containing protein-containing protein n=1 Tax=Lentinula detonsa TaxID=2804962 RepID=A0AA38PXM7_9AGAR|nr:RlpA-like double-psi beta-barrel-protein domain-containing protein-containing protein [Lentinula detonsa]